MRVRELQNFWHYRRFLRNAWTAAGARRSGVAGDLVALELKRGGKLFTRRRTPDMRVFRDIFVKDVYNVDAIEPLLSGDGPPLDTVVDVGGHIGIFSIRIAPLARRVVACEPIPENADLLLRNLDAARCSNVTLERCAVTSDSRDVLIYTAANPGGHSALKSLSGRQAKVEKVRGRPLSDIFSAHSIDRCDFLKIDCEGGEYEILLSAGPALLSRVQRISLEYHNAVADDPRYTGEELERVLADSGFHVRRLPSRRHENYGLLHARRR